MATHYTEFADELEEVLSADTVKTEYSLRTSYL